MLKSVNSGGSGAEIAWTRQITDVDEYIQNRESVAFEFITVSVEVKYYHFYRFALACSSRASLNYAVPCSPVVVYFA